MDGLFCRGWGGKEEGLKGVEIYGVVVLAGDGKKYGDDQLWSSSTRCDHCGPMQMAVGYYVQDPTI